MPNGNNGTNSLARGFSKAASGISTAAGKPAVFALAVLTIIVWAASGPLFGYSDMWQLVINTGTTIITFMLSHPELSEPRWRRRPSEAR